MSAMSRIALGMVRRGSTVSSVSVVTASKPRNEYAASAAPAETPPQVVLSLTNGVTLNHAPAPSAASRCRSDSATKIATTSSWKAISR